VSGPLTAADRLDIMELYARYAWAIDSGDVDAYVGNFVPDANLFGHVGHAAIRTYYEGFLRDSAFPGSQHLASQFIIDGDAERARARAYVIRFHRIPGTTNNQVIFLGFYNDVCAKVDGKWYFEVKSGHLPEELQDRELALEPSSAGRTTYPRLWDRGAVRDV
jgi:hypothetical protein